MDKSQGSRKSDKNADLWPANMIYISFFSNLHCISFMWWKDVVYYIYHGFSEIKELKQRDFYEFIKGKAMIYMLCNIIDT